jgi:hypothetical protein
MLRSSLNFILLLLLFTSWHRKEEPLVSSFLDPKDSFLERTLASSTENCFKDKYTVQSLKEEVKKLEKEFSETEGVSGYWKNLDLSRLPLPQALFLKRFGDRLGDLSGADTVSYDGCEDVPCVFNRIYGKESGAEGYVHYLWFLKFGIYLAADNQIPLQASSLAGHYQNTHLPLKDFLWSPEEIYGFWHLSHQMSGLHGSLKYLREIQRIPKRQIIEGRSKNICGLASATITGGWIILPDCGLEFPDFYRIVWHELSHHVDAELGGMTRENFYYSYKKDYIELAGFKFVEYVDKGGLLVPKWEVPAQMKFVSGYAKAAPEENFAETAAYFRMKGDWTQKSISAEHFSFMKDSVYSGRSFNEEASLKLWISSLGSELDSRALRDLVFCSENKSTSCFDQQLKKSTETFRNRVSLERPEACDLFGKQEVKNKWNLLFQEEWSKSVSKYQGLIQSDKNGLRFLARSETFNPRKLSSLAALTCYESDEACYKREIQSHLEESSREDQLLPETISTLIQFVLSVYPFKEQRFEIEAGYRKLLLMNSGLIYKTGERLWKSCAALPPNNQVAPSGTLFQVGAGHMVSSLYNCLNSALPGTVRNTLPQIQLGEKNLSDSNEEKIFAKSLMLEFTKVLTEIYEREKEAELKKAKDAYYGKPFVPVKKPTFEQCRDEFIKQIKFEPLFHQKKELFGEFLKASMKTFCPNVP